MKIRYPNLFPPPPTVPHQNLSRRPSEEWLIAIPPDSRPVARFNIFRKRNNRHSCLKQHFFRSRVSNVDNAATASQPLRRRIATRSPIALHTETHHPPHQVRILLIVTNAVLIVQKRRLLIEQIARADRESHLLQRPIPRQL